MYRMILGRTRILLYDDSAMNNMFLIEKNGEEYDVLNNLKATLRD